VADYYEILGVARQASSAEIRQAYLRLAKERHPDRFSDPAEKERAQAFFKDLTAAFNTLFNDRTRREYDEELAKPKAAAPEEIAKNAYGQGVARYEAKDYHSAVELLRTAAQIAPGEARYRAALGRALAKNPHWVREAVAELEEAIRLDPRRAAYHAELAAVMLGQGLRLRARRAAEAALRLAPDDSEVQRLARETGALEEAPQPKEAGGLKGLLRRKE
jgi:predicted Zn-dependent protease